MACHSLDRWLDDPEQPSRLFLAAPAGRGKSALLVRWSQSLLKRPSPPHIVFFPVSVRFRTNLASVVFPALAARLALLHGEALCLPAETRADIWHEMAASYLSRPLPNNEQLLLIIDGADEAADWEAGPEFIPSNLPSTTRIVMSGRLLAGDTDPRTWLRRMGWERAGVAVAMDLAALDHAGVADVLHEPRYAAHCLATRADVVSELHRLSEGDPLLVRLYVDDLWGMGEPAARLQPEDLAAFQPGLDGYFARWWDDQRQIWGAKSPLREPIVQALLNVLSCAMGPLRREDLVQLAPPELRLDHWLVEDALHQLRRFIIGDGVVQGYTLSHPRLASYFYDKLAHSGTAARQDGRFIEWGNRTITLLQEGALSSESVPLYLLQYYRAHLHRTGSDPGQMLGLISPAWLEAWKRVDRGSYVGFAREVEYVWKIGEHADLRDLESNKPAKHLPAAVRCALYTSSIASLAANAPHELLAELVRREIWSAAQALAFVSHIANLSERASAIQRLAATVQTHDRQMVTASLTTVLRAVGNERDRFILLQQLLTRPAPVYILELFFEAARRVQDEDGRQELLSKLANSLASIGTVESVAILIRLAEESRDPLTRYRTLSNAFVHADTSQRDRITEDLIRTLGSIEPTSARIDLMSSLISSVPPSHCRRVSMIAVGIASGISPLSRRIRELQSWAELFVRRAPTQTSYQSNGDAAPCNETGDTAEMDEEIREARALLHEAAFNACCEITGNIPRLAALGSLACRCDEPLRARATAAGVDALARAELSPDDARAASEQIRPFIAGAMGLTGRDRDRLHRFALEAAASLRQERYRVLRIAEIARHCSAAVFQEALDALERNSDHLQMGLLEPASSSWDIERRSQAFKRWMPAWLRLVERLRNESDRASVLAELVWYLPDELLSEAKRIVRKFVDAEPRLRVLTELAWRSHGVQGAALDAVEAARQVRDPRGMALALARLACDWPDPPPCDVLSEALDAVREVDGLHERMELLHLLRRELPEPLRERTSEAMMECVSGIADPLKRLRALREQSLFGGAHSERVREEAARTAAQLLLDAASAPPIRAILSMFSGADLERLLSQLVAAFERGVGLASADASTETSERSASQLRIRELIEAIRLLAHEHDKPDRMTTRAALLEAAQRLAGEALCSRGDSESTTDSSQGPVIAYSAPEATGHALMADVLVGKLESALKGSRSLLGEIVLSAEPAELREAVEQLEEPMSRVLVLTEAVERISGSARSEVLADALREAGSFGARDAAANSALDACKQRLLEAALSFLMPKDPAVADCIHVARSFQSEPSRVKHLAAFGPLSGVASRRLIMNAVLSVQDLAGRGEIWWAMCRAHGEELVIAEILEAACGALDDEGFSELLLQLPSALPLRQMDPLIHAARAIGGAFARSRALAGLATYVNLEVAQGLFIEAMTSSEDLDVHWDAVLSAAAPPARRAELVSIILHRLPRISDPLVRTSRLNALVHLMTDDQLREMSGSLHLIGDQAERASTLGSLLSTVSPQARNPATHRKAVQTAHAISDSEEKIRVLAALARTASVADQREIHASMVAATRSITDLAVRGRLLTVVAPELSEADESVLQELLVLAETVDPHFGAEVATTMGPHIPAYLAPRALRIALRARRDATLAKAIRTLAPRLPPASAGDALQVAHRIDEGYWRAEVLGALGPVLTPALRRLGEVVARTARRPEDRVRCLVALAPTSENGEQLIAEALRTIGRISSPSQRADVLCEMAEAISDDLGGPALDAVGTIDDETSLARALTAIGPHLHPRYLRRALRELDTISDVTRRTTVAAAFAPCAAPSDMRLALDQIRAVRDPEERVRAFARLAARSRGQDRSRSLEAAWSSVRLIRDERAKFRVLVWCCGVLPDSLPSAVAAIFQITDENVRAEAAVALAAQADADAAPELMQLCATLSDGRSRADVLVALGSRMPATCVERAIAIAASIPQASHRVRALCSFAHGLTPGALGMILDEAARLQRPTDRAEVSLAVALGNTVAPDTLNRVFDDIWGIPDDQYRAGMLVRVIPRLSPSLLSRLLERLGEIQSGMSRFEVLQAAVEYACDETIDLLERTVRGLSDGAGTAVLLAQLSCKLGDDARDRAAGAAVEMALRLPSRIARADTLQEMSLRMQSPTILVLSESLHAAALVPGGSYHVSALQRLMPLCAGPLFSECLRAVAAVGAAPERAELLAGLARHGPPERFGEIIAEIASLPRDTARCSALISCSDIIPESQVDSVVSIASSIRSESLRVDAFAALAPGRQIWPAAIADLRKVRSETVRYAGLLRLLPFWPDDRLSSAIELIGVLHNDAYRSSLLTRLNRLPHECEQATLEIANSISDAPCRVRALASLSRHMLPSTRAQLLAGVISDIALMENERDRAQALLTIAGSCHDQTKNVAAAAAQTLHDVESRYECEAALEMSCDAAQAALSEMLRAMNGSKPANIVERSTPWAGRATDSAVVARLRLRAQTMHANCDRLSLLRQLEPAAAGPAMAEALSVAWSMTGEEYRVAGIRAIAPGFAEADIMQALPLLLTIESNPLRRAATAAMNTALRRCHPKIQYSCIQELLRKASAQGRAKVLIVIEALAPTIVALCGEPAAESIADAVRDTGDRWR